MSLTTENSKKPSKPPVFKDRIGSTEVAIFINEWKDNSSYSIKIAKNYRTDEGFKQTNSFTRRDLEDLQTCLSRGQAYMAENPLNLPDLSTQKTPAKSRSKSPAPAM